MMLDKAAGPLAWLQAFPWLEAVPASVLEAQWVRSAGEWRELISQPVEEKGLVPADLVTVIGDFMSLWTLEELFPLLDGAAFAAVIRDVRPDSRVASPFDEDPDALANIDVFELAHVLGGSIRDTDRSVGRFVSLHLERAQAEAVHESPVIARAPEPVVDLMQQILNVGTGDVLTDIKAIVRYQLAMGRSDAAVFDHDPSLELPREIGAALQRVLAAPARNFAYLLDDAGSPADRLAALVVDESPMALAALKQRTFADRPLQLEVIGQQFGVTRERVRQVAAQARTRFETAVQADGVLRTVNDGILSAVGGLLPLADLLDAYPGLAIEVPGIDQPVWRVLDRIDDAYEIEDGWCASPSVRGARTETRTVAESLANAHGVVGAEALASHLAEQGIRVGEDGAGEAWFDYCGLERLEYHVLVGARSIVDRAAAVLSIAETPLGSEEILRRTRQDRSLQSLKNGLGADQRFMRVDRDEWALVEWDLEEYTNIRGLIARELDRCGGSLPLRDLVAAICDRYDVAESSVNIYASSPPYVTSGGIVSRIGSRAPIAVKPAERTRWLYRLDSGWAYRSTLNADHARGSGTGLPPGVAAALDLAFGGTREFAGASGPVTVRWIGPQPALSTIRRELAESDLSIGDPVLFIFGDDGSFEIRAVPDTGHVGLARVRELTGLVPHNGQDVDDLARALGVPDAASLTDVLRWVVERGDADLVALLEAIVARAAQRAPSERGSEPASGHADESGVVAGLSELVAIQQEFKLAQRMGQFALAEQIQAEYGPKLRRFMKESGMDLATLLGLLEAAAAGDGVPGGE